MRAQISEIFQSIQGEGKYAGVRQIFVRFFGCNMRCVWCDTPQSIGDTTKGYTYTEESVEELMEKVEILQEGVQSVSLTGGEPLLQKDFIKAFLPELKKLKFPVHLETNGIFYKDLEDIIDAVDVVAMDIKLPSSTQEKSFWVEHERFLQRAIQKETFIKMVVSNETEKKDVLKAIDLTASVDPDVFFILQPNYLDIRHDIIQKCFEYQNDCLTRLKNVRIMPQMHKFMKIR